MAYWDRGPYKIVTHHPLSSETISILYDNNDILSKLSSGEDPVDLSILKWEKVFTVYAIISAKNHPYLYYSDIYPYIGYKTCALCLTSIKKYEELHGTYVYKENKCSVCPFAQIDRCIDEKSTYSKIDRILSNNIDFGDSMDNKEQLFLQFKELGQLIDTMIRLLKKTQ